MALPRQRMDVELANGDVFEGLEAINPDMIRYETEGHKYGLGPVGDAPFTYMTFLAWCALKRLGKYGGDWVTFKTSDCVVLVPEGADEDGDVPAVDPTAPAPEPSSA